MKGKLPSWVALFTFVPLAFAISQPTRTIVARQDPNQTTAIGLPASTPQLSFNRIFMTTTCQSGSLTWLYSGPENVMMDLIITNVDVPQDGNTSNTESRSNTFTNGGNAVGGDLGRKRAPPIHSEPPLITEIIKTISPGPQLFSWDKINVPEGNYMFLANFTAFARTPFKSPSFFISNGTDTSCLVTQPGTSSSASPSGSLPTTSTSPPPAESSSPVLPIGSSSKVNKGAVAGGIVGGLAVLAAAFAAFLFLRCSPGRRDSAFGKWGNIGSFDSKASTSRAPPKSKSNLYNGRNVGIAGLGLGIADPQGRHKSHSESMGPIMASQRSEDHMYPGTSDEHIDEEKYSRSDMSHEMTTVGYGSPPRNPVRNSSTSSTYSYGQNYNYSRPRSQSNKYGVTNSPSPQTFPESVSNTTINSRRASSPPIGGTGTHHHSESYPPSPAYPSGISGVVFTGAPGAPTGPSDSDTSISALPAAPIARRTPRKPVPKYSPTEDIAQNVPTDVQDNDLPGVPHVLTHKNSQGSVKQMHYLMPDLPPPQRD